MFIEQSTVVSKSAVFEKIDNMDRELKFLWQEANEEEFPDLKDRKIKQFWDLYRLYRKQKAFLKAMAEE